MSVYARSDLAAVTVSEAHGGCGQTHSRPAPGGIASAVWHLDCAVCSDHLRHDPHWSVTAVDVPETYDETRARDDFDKRGAKDRDLLRDLALAKIAGLDIPETLRRQLSGIPAHIPGELICPSGHPSAPGQKFCGECGSVMSAAVAKGALPAAQEAVEPPGDDGGDRKPRRLRDARLDELQALARDKGLDDSGTRSDLISRLSDAGVTNNDLAALTVAA